jgi:hypothetical protein
VRSDQPRRDEEWSPRRKPWVFVVGTVHVLEKQDFESLFSMLIQPLTEINLFQGPRNLAKNRLPCDISQAGQAFLLYEALKPSSVK